METRVKEIKVIDGREVKVMEWLGTENKDKSWGSAGYDRHYIN